MAGEPSLGKAVLEIGTDTRELKRDLTTIKKRAQATGRDVKSIGANLNLIVWAKFGQIAGRALKAVGAELIELGRRGAAVDDVSQAFTTLSRNASSSAQVMLGELRSGVRGTISDFELMQLANKPLGAQLIRSAEDMGTLAEGARSLGKATGIDTKRAFETMTTAIASGRTAQLKQLGLFVDNKKSVEDYAASIGKTVSTMTDFDRAQALAGATLSAIRARLAEIPPAAADFGEVMDGLSSRVNNFRDALAVAVSSSPAITAGLAELSKAFDEAFGTNQAENVSALSRIIDAMAFAFVDGVRIMLQAGKFLVGLFQEAKVIFQGVLSGLAFGLNLATQAIADLADKAAQLPVVGSQFQGIADSIRGAADMTSSLEHGFSTLFAETHTNMLKTRAGFDGMIGTIDNVKASMLEAQRAAAASGATMTTVLTETATQAQAVATNALNSTQLALEQEALLAQNASQQRAALAQQEAVMAGAMNAAILESTAHRYATVDELAAASGFKTRQELQKIAQTAQFTYQRMLASGKFTAEQLTLAFEQYQEAKRASEGETLQMQLDSGNAWATGTQGILQEVGKKNKAAAIAGALISTYASVAKSLASAPWPANLVLAAGALAAGLSQVNRIRSSDPGYASGTPNLDFANFGSVTKTDLHGQEAVVPRGGGHRLAAEIAASLPGGMGADAGVLERLDRIAEGLDELPNAIRRGFRSTALQTLGANS